MIACHGNIITWRRKEHYYERKREIKRELLIQVSFIKVLSISPRSGSRDFLILNGIKSCISSGPLDSINEISYILSFIYELFLINYRFLFFSTRTMGRWARIERVFDKSLSRRCIGVVWMMWYKSIISWLKWREIFISRWTSTAARIYSPLIDDRRVNG